ncbi:MAG: hypothetical protein L0Y74_00240, partial [candidate division Zixibacteria bacterium]|nr:hypothetical protein [candidate division Zixibacteria bacterium]
QEAGGPVCIALALPPEHLSRFEKFSSVLLLSADNIQADPLTGVYRLRFYLADKEGNSLPPEKSISNHFSIVP